MKEKHNFTRRGLLAGFLALVLLFSAIPVSAYLNATYRILGKANIGINLMFDNFTSEALKRYQDANKDILPDKAENPDAYEWGHVGNPYVISHPQHLQNLSRLQNAGVLDGIFKSSDDKMPCFVVSTNAYTPVVVGGVTIEPVGNADYPFYGTLSGVTGTEKNLNGSVKTNTSAIHDVTITSNGQPDIGFFGHVTCLGDPAGTYTPSKVENMVFSDVKLKATESSVFDRLHKWFQGVLGKDDPNPHETNHLGIIAGHVTYSTMKDLSVYYSSSDVKAVEMSSPEEMNYLCGTGFFGLLDHLNPGNDQKPDGWGNEDFGAAGSDGGGTDYGKDPGYIRPEELFKLGTGGEDGEVKLTDIEGILKPSADNPPKSIIYDGVFAFAPSSDADSIKNIWAPEVQQFRQVRTFDWSTPSQSVSPGGSESQENTPIPTAPEQTEQDSVDIPEETTNEEETVPETSVPATEETVPETSVPATEETVPETTVPTTEPAEKEVQVTFLKDPADLKLTIWRMVGDKKEYQVTIQEMEDLIMTAEEPTQEQIKNYLQLEEGSLVRQAQTDPQKPDLYLLPPDAYFFNADREGYVSVEERSFTVDPRSDSMKIEVTLEQAAPEETEAPTEAPTELPTEVPTEAPTEAATEAPTEAATEIPTETAAEEAAEVPEEIPAESALRGKNVLHLVSDGRVLPDLYFGNGDQIKLCSLSDVSYQIPIVTLPASSEPEEQTEAPAEKATEPAAMETVPEAEAPKEEETVPETEAPAEEGTVPETEAPETAPTYPDMITPEAVPVPEQSSGTWKPQAPRANKREIIFIVPDCIKNSTAKIVVNSSQDGVITTGAKENWKCNIEYGSKCTYSLEYNGNSVAGIEFSVWESKSVKVQGAAVVFQNIPNGASLILRKNGKIVPGTSTQRDYFLSSGNYTYIVEQTGYKKLEGTINVPQKENWELPYQMSVKVNNLIPLPRYTIEFVFADEPQGTPTISVWPEGNTDSPIISEQNPRIYKLSEGNYEYSITCKGYKELKGKFTVTGASKINVKLEENAPRINVTFQCNTGAKNIEVRDSSGKICQVTKETATKFTAKLYEGDYTYTAEPENTAYGKASGSFMLVKNPVTVNVEFMKPVTVSFKGMPDGTTIQLWQTQHGQKVGKTIQLDSSTGYQCNLLPGRYVYQAVCPGYLSGTETEFTVSEGTDATVEISLIKAAEITFACTPQNAIITLTSKANGQVCMPRSQQEAYVYDLPAGEYFYSASANGYVSDEHNLTVADKEVKTVVVKLERLPGAVVEFICQTKGMELQLWSVKDGRKTLVPVTIAPHTYVLETGDYVYTARKPNAKNLAKFEDVPLHAEAGKNQTITLKLPALKKVSFRCNPEDLTIEFFYMMDGRKIPYQVTAQTGANRSYQLPESGCFYRASRTGYDPTKDTEIKKSQYTIKLVDANFSVPPEGVVPPMNIPDGVTGGPDTIKLIPVNEDVHWVSGITDGQYCVYLQKLSTEADIRLDDPNARYLICPKGYERPRDGHESAYLALPCNEQEAIGAVEGLRLSTATFSDGAGWQKSQECKFNGTPSLVMSFATAQDRKTTLENVGLQIVSSGAQQGPYHIRQSEWIDGGRNFYLGISENKTPGHGWGKILVRSIDKQNVGWATDPSIYNLTISGSSGSFEIYAQTNTGMCLGYHFKPELADGVAINHFLGGSNGSQQMKTMEIYQVVGYDFIPAADAQGKESGKFVPNNEEKALTFKADQYVLWKEPEKLETNLVSQDPYQVTFELRSIDELKWNLRNGQPMTSANYRPSKMFSLQSSPLMSNAWIGGAEGTTLHVKLGKAQKSYKVPYGTLSFYVSEQKNNSYVRILARVPTSTVQFTGSMGNISRLGIWQQHDGGYRVDHPRMSVPLPVSQPLRSTDEEHYIRVNYKAPGQSNAEQYKLYLQGETVLCAVEFSLNNIYPLYGFENQGGKTVPGPFFLTQSFQPMQFAYCAAEGVADGAPEIITGGNGSVELGNIDFVYDDGKLVTTVTDHEGSGASVYRRSDVLFQFMNIEGKTGSFKYNQVNEGWASIYRQYAGGGPVISLTKGGADAPYMKINPTGENPDTIQQ